MPFSYRDWVFGGTTFCCCLPVRFGVICLSIVTMLFAGVLSIILWFEVAASSLMTAGEKAAFVIGGLVETFLFAASIFGLVGTFVRKQSFIQIYAIIVYVHFFLNIIVAAVILFIVGRFSTVAEKAACEKTIHDSQAKDQCIGLLRVGIGIYVGVAAFILLSEMYGAIIVTRYLNQVKREKRTTRMSLQQTNTAFRLTSTTGRYSVLRETPLIEPDLHHYGEQDFNPYETTTTENPVRHSEASLYDATATPSGEVGYGGGSWTHDGITQEEKVRLQRLEQEMGRATIPRDVDALPLYTPLNPTH